MTTQWQEHNALALLLLGSDWLRYQLSLRERDNQRLRNGEHLVYAVDTNILYIYVVYKSDQALEFANLLRSSLLPPAMNRMISGGLEFINNYLGTYILWKLSHGQPLLMFPSVETETSIAIKDWLKNYKQARLQNITDLIWNMFKGKKVDPDPLMLAKFIEITKKEIDSLFDSPTFEQFFRIKNLVDAKCIIRAQGSDIKFSKTDSYKIEIPSLAGKFQLKDVFDYRKGVYEWFEQIKNFKGQSVPNTKIFNDAESIVLLEHVNRGLVSKKCRLILITSDLALMSACALKGLEKYDNLSGFSNVAEAYLRHPYSFLADADVWLSKSEENISFNKLKDILLPSIEKKLDGKELMRAYRESEPFSEHIKLAYRSARTHQEATENVRKFYENWNDLWQKINSATFVEHTLEYTLKKKSGLDDLRKKVLSHTNFTAALMELIFTPVRNLIQSAGEVFDLPMISQSAAREGERYPRGLPPIIFDGCNTAYTKYRQLLDTPENYALTPSGDELIYEDPTLYNFCLFIATALCVFNHLERAMIFAKQAALISDRELKHLTYADPNKCGFVSGREAYYLLAYLTRINVDNPDKLKEVKKLLTTAAQRYQKEEEIKKGIKEEIKEKLSTMTFNDYLALDDLRFASLFLSSEISQLLFNRYQPNEVRNSNEQLIKLAKKIVEMLDKCLSKLSEQIKAKPAKVKKYEVRILQGDLLCNLLVLQIEIYAIDQKEIDTNQTNQISKWIEDLRENLWPSDPKLEWIKEKPKSEYIQLILWISELLFSSQNDPLPLKEKCLNFLTQEKRMQVFSYDKERFHCYAGMLIEKFKKNRIMAL